MSNKNKDKVPKAGKTRLSDLRPEKQARGGRIPEGGGGPDTPPSFFHPSKKVANSPVARGITVPPF
jgi:hypothetical protein